MGWTICTRRFYLGTGDRRLVNSASERGKIIVGACGRGWWNWPFRFPVLAPATGSFGSCMHSTHPQRSRDCGGSVIWLTAYVVSFHSTMRCQDLTPEILLVREVTRKLAPQLLKARRQQALLREKKRKSA
jgi:hypothetical protein